MALLGCDTFVVLPPLTGNGEIIFGKNSDRPNGEVQEVVYRPSKHFEDGEKLQCTYIVIDQVTSTNAVLLSKPAWMWGAEMGANDHGVVIGNEAVWTVVEDDSETERLLGMDLLRLGLERAKSGSEAVSVITQLLEKYGQGGPCSDTDSGLLYHNSFLIADKNEAWVLETAGKLWAAERITSGHKNISNCLSIGTNISKMSDDVLKYVKEKHLWSGVGQFNFKNALSSSQGCPREIAGQKLLSELSSNKQFDIDKMFQVLRNKKSGICRPAYDAFHTSGSWVSVLHTPDENKPPCHWITATPDPSVSLFKPFVFTPNPVLPADIVSPIYSQDPAKCKPRFQFTVDRQHRLYKLHAKAYRDEKTAKVLREVEKTLVENTLTTLQAVKNNKVALESCKELLKSAVEREVKAYMEISQ